MAQSITGYADDFHASDRVKSYQDLENAEYRFGSLLDVLADANMCINQKKSAILLRVRGSFAQRWLRHHQLKRDTGPHLRIRTPKATIRVSAEGTSRLLGSENIVLFVREAHRGTSHTGGQSHLAEASPNPLLTHSVGCVEAPCNLESHGDTHSDVWIGRGCTRSQGHLSNATPTHQAGSSDYSPLCAPQQSLHPGTAPPLSLIYSPGHVA